jgi:hypothetical protein
MKLFKIFTVTGAFLLSISAKGNVIQSFSKPTAIYSIPPGDTPNPETGLINPGVVKCKDNVVGDEVRVDHSKKSSEISGYVFVKALSGACKNQEGYVAKWHLKK